MQPFILILSLLPRVSYAGSAPKSVGEAMGDDNRGAAIPYGATDVASDVCEESQKAAGPLPENNSSEAGEGQTAPSASAPDISPRNLPRLCRTQSHLGPTS